jgi:DNA-binding beta-propeller fold protein YncE
MPLLLGTAPNQVPTNGDLGTMAFQDAAAIRVGALAAGTLTTGTLAAGATSTTSVTVAGDTRVSNVNMLNASYDSVSFSVQAQDVTPNALFFSPDGQKMFVLGAAGDDVNEYLLSTPWVVSSAVYSTLFSVAAQDIAAVGMFFRADGLKMYVAGTTNDTVYQYALTSPWSVATASYESKSFSVAAQDTTLGGVFFDASGLSMYVIGSIFDGVYQYTLATAWDVSTAAYLQTFSVATQELTPQDLAFTNDGTRMFVIGSTNDNVNVYDLTTPWNIITSTFVGSFSVAGQDTVPAGIYVKPDGTKMYMVGQTNDTVYQYTIPSVKIQLTGTATINGNATVEQDLTVRGNTALLDLNVAGLLTPQQATTALAPAYVKGAMYFDITLNKLRIGGVTAWETVTSS